MPGLVSVRVSAYMLVEEAHIVGISRETSESIPFSHVLDQRDSRSRTPPGPF